LRTFLIADVRGYTRYTQQHGDEAAARLAATFAELVRTAVRAHEGRLIELRGDEALVVFESARNALRAALAMQAALEREDMARGVGIGLDAGEAVPVGKGYRGGALNMAARLCSLADPGEVLASEAVVHLARKIDGIRYLDGRVERLKGLEHPVRVVEVVPQERAVARIRAVRRRLHGRRWPAVVGALAVAVAVAAAVAVVAATRGGSAPTLSALHTVAVFDAHGGYVGGVATGVDTYDVRYVAGALWSLDAGGTVVKIDPAKRQIELPVSVGNDNGWTVGDGAVWVVSADKPVVTRVDARYGSTTSITLPTAGLHGGDPHGNAIAFGAGSLWIAQNHGSTIARIDPATGKLLRRIATPDTTVLRFGDGALYAVDQSVGDFEKIDPKFDSAAWTGHIHPWIADVLPAAGVLWLVVDSDAGVYRFSEADGTQLGFTHTGDGSGALAYGAGAVWVSNWRAGTVSRVSPVTSTAVSFPTGNAPGGLAVTPAGDVFVGITPRPPDVAATLHGAVAHIVLREDWLDQIDPAVRWNQRAWELEYATEAKLYNYPDWSGTNPSQVVPEIAAAMPTVTHRAGVWSYAIPIRAGYRFSPPSNAPVTAETMRYSIERALSPALNNGFEPGQTFLSVCAPAPGAPCPWHLVGAGAFVSGKARRLAGLTAHDSTLLIRTTGPVPELVDLLALPFFSAVPIGTPAANFDAAAHPIPSAGPYYVSYQNVGWQTVLRHNPNYRGPRPHRLDAVVYDVGIDTGPAAARVEQGTLDYESESYPDYGVLAPSGAIARRYGATHPTAGRPWFAAVPMPNLDWLEMNTSRGLMADVRVRRAIDLAVDRPALAAVSGGIPANQYLPPSMMGAGAPTTPVRSPSPADLARARTLLGHRHASVTLQIQTGNAFNTQVATLVRDDLPRIGLHVVIRKVANVYEPTTAARADMLLYGWFFDFWDPSNLLPAVLFSHDPNSNPFGFSSARWARADARAGQLAGAARLAAYAAVARGVHRADVPWVVLDQRAQPAFFSARLGCIQFPPAYSGVDIAALCTRG
jgi:peptide/nickel transport system substrate-binding protein